MKLLLKGFLFLTLVSCAQQQIILEEERLTPFEGFRDLTYLPFATLPVKLLAVSDNRGAQEGIGQAKTGARFKETPVYLKGPFLEVFRDYLREELKKRNVLMVQEDEKISLNVMIEQFWVEEVIEKYEPEKAKCRVSLEVNASKGEESYNGKFWTEIVSPGDMGDATEKLAATVASCMNMTVEKMVKDKKFVEFIKAGPLLE